MKRSVGLLICGLLLACAAEANRLQSEQSHEPREHAPPARPGDAALMPPFTLATQTGNPPSPVCPPVSFVRSAVECAELAGASLSRYREPRPIRYLEAGSQVYRDAQAPYSISQCVAPERAPQWVARSLPSEPFCMCASAADDLSPVALGRFGLPESYAPDQPAPDCGQRSQAYEEFEWACLYREADFPGCAPSDAGSCDGVCSAFRERSLAQHAATFGNVRRSTFLPDGDACSAGHCLLILELAGACYVEGPWSGCGGLAPSGAGHDCSLSDSDLLTRAGFDAAPAQRDAGAEACPVEAADAGAP